MSAATIPQPDAEDDWEPIDEAVRDHLGELLTAGTNLFSGSQLMDRLDPLSIFAPLLRTGFDDARESATNGNGGKGTVDCPRRRASGPIGSDSRQRDSKDPPVPDRLT